MRSSDAGVNIRVGVKSVLKSINRKCLDNSVAVSAPSSFKSPCNDTVSLLYESYVSKVNRTKLGVLAEYLRAGNLIFHRLQSVYQGPNFAGTARREGRGCYLLKAVHSRDKGEEPVLPDSLLERQLTL